MADAKEAREDRAHQNRALEIQRCVQQTGKWFRIREVYQIEGTYESRFPYQLTFLSVHRRSVQLRRDDVLQSADEGAGNHSAAHLTKQKCTRLAYKGQASTCISTWPAAVSVPVTAVDSISTMSCSARDYL